MLKKIAVACALMSCSIGAFAGETGWYLGLQLGEARTNYNNVTQLFNNTLGASGPYKQSGNSNNPAARIYLGYEFNKYLAAELGGTGIKRLNWKNLYGININGVNSATGTVQQINGDLSLKPILPLSNNFQIYGILGATYVDLRTSVNRTAKNAGITTIQNNSTRPVYGAGAEIYFYQYWAVDLSWRRIDTSNFNSSTTSSKVQQSDFTMLGIAYHFHNPDSDC